MIVKVGQGFEQDPIQINDQAGGGWYLGTTDKCPTLQEKITGCCWGNSPPKRTICVLNLQVEGRSGQFNAEGLNFSSNSTL